MSLRAFSQPDYCDLYAIEYNAYAATYQVVPCPYHLLNGRQRPLCPLGTIPTKKSSSSPTLTNSFMRVSVQAKVISLPDGKFLIFQSERMDSNPFYQIYTLDLESGESYRVSPGYGKTTCSFFIPNSNRVIFASTHLDPQALEKEKAELDFRATGKKRRYSWDYDATMEIFSADRSGSDIKRLTDSPGYDAEGSVSPDGKKIVFCSNRSAYDHVS